MAPGRVDREGETPHCATHEPSGTPPIILRACADHVASLTERQAEAAYRRLFGFDMGAITDAI